MNQNRPTVLKIAIPNIAMMIQPPKVVSDAGNRIIYHNRVQQWDGVQWKDVEPLTEKTDPNIPMVIE